MNFGDKMKWMYWLSEDEQSTLKNRIEKTIPCELNKNRWGTNAPGKHDGIKQFYIADFRALNLVTGIIRYTLRNTNTKIFYRGQERDWPLIPSLYRNSKNQAEAIAAENKLIKILEIAKTHFDPEGTDEEREALAQHYGLHTRWFDVLDNIQSALWFAYDRTYTPLNRIQQYDEDVGYIYILAFPQDSSKVKILDLRQKPSQFLRPHVQQAYSLSTISPRKELGRLSAYNVITLIIPRSLLKLWCNYENIPSHYMYPNNITDAGLRFWEHTKEDIISAGFVNEL